MKSTKNLPPRTGRLKLPLGTMFWHELGQGEAVVFLHGSWQDSLQWLPLIETLGLDFHCLAPDLIGFGESKGEQLSSIALQVETLAAFLKTLRVSRLFLVGHSLGAWVALQFALHHPDLVSALVVIAPEGLEPTLEGKRWQLHHWLAGRYSLFALGLKTVTPLVELLGGQNWLRHTQALREQLRQFPTACRLLFRRRKAEIRGELVQPRLNQLKAPAMVLLPESAEPLEQDLSKAFFSALPTAQIQSIPNADTAWGMALDPTAAALKAFFRQQG